MLACDSGPDVAPQSASVEDTARTAEAAEAANGEHRDAVPYPHPLQGVALIDGKIPFLDLHTAPSGRLYALFEGGGEEASQEYENDPESGVIEVDVRPITAAEQAEIDAVAPDIEPYVHTTIGPRLEAMIAAEHDNLESVFVETLVRVERPPTDTVTLRIARAVAEGQVDTLADRDAVRVTIIEDVAEEVAAVVDPVATQISELGATPRILGALTTTIGASMSLAQVAAVAGLAEVVTINLVTPGALGGVDGQEKAQAMQHRLFWDESWSCYFSLQCNYDGDNGLAKIYAAVMDPTAFRDQHVAFKSGSGSLTRIAEMWDCLGGSCGQESAGGWTPPAQSHGTWVLGALLGDYRDGQDSGVTGTDAREQRSAAAGEAAAYLYKGGYSDLATVLSHTAARSPAPHLFVTAVGDPGTAPDFGDCNGDTSADASVDDLFESGIAYFGLAGNDLTVPVDSYDTAGISGSTSNCTAWDPTAISAFTVGAWTDSGSDDSCDMRTSAIEAQSAWGGANPSLAFNEGRGRSVIDAAGPWSGGPLPKWTSNTATSNYSGTSHATPSVASAAIDFIDMMKNVRGSSMIDDPGMLYAWMLNNADRGWSSGSSKLVVGYDARFGAGRTNLRFINDIGMDSPWKWYHWEVCVPHAQVVTLTLNGGNAFPSDYESIRATAWWYDRRFQSGTFLDNINLSLKTTGGTPLRTSQSFYDNKERIHYTDIGGKAVKLELSGTSVTSDGEGCGTNSMRVWVTVLAEDDDRDDANGPAYDAPPGTCEGVQLL